MFTIKRFTFNPFQENTYLLYNEKNECIVIDPGCYFKEEEHELMNFISKSSIMPKLLLNTHCHLDHIFGNDLIAKKFNLTLQLHEQEVAMLQYAPAASLMWNVPFQNNYTGAYTFLKEGDEILMGADILKVIEAPGHSPGSLCFYCEKQKFIICGDVLFKQSIGRTDLPGGNYDLLIKNIQEKLMILPKDVMVYSGHGEPTSIGDEKLNNPFIFS